MSNNKSLSQTITNISDSLSFKSDYGNELFLYHELPKIEEEFFNENNAHRSLEPTSKRSLLKNSIWNIMFTSLYLFLFIPFTFIATFCLSVYLLLFKINSDEIKSNKLSVIRTKAAWDKLKAQENFKNYFYIFDDLSFNHKDGFSLYKQPLISRLLCLINMPKAFYIDCMTLYLDIRKLINTQERLKIIKRLTLRLPLKLMYGLYLESILRSSNCSSFLSGNKEDRYAMLEKKVCRKIGVSTICVPHGLEYGFKVPKGLFGDQFYCTSIKSKEILENIYRESSQQFVFDEKIAKQMFAPVTHRISTLKPKMVFFPESREIDVNKQIIEQLLEVEGELYLKLHPLDSFSNYSSLVTKGVVIEELDQALDGNICLARKSTVLLESIYRGGYPCALLFNQKDKVYVEQIFPSLSNQKITSVYNLGELKKFLNGV
jgi:hypothetical protein